jgi:aminoglycoside 6'-N-acetyltransferase
VSITSPSPGPAAGPGELFTWRRVTGDDLGLLRDWLARPHVRRWWNHDTSAAAVERDFGPAARGQEPSEDLLVSLDGRPFGLVQRCRLIDYPEYLAELRALAAAPDDAITLDYFVADPDQTGRGLGPAMLDRIVERSWGDHPAATCVLVPVVATNRASWRALEKIGFTRVGEGDLVPDNPRDPPLHFVYRADRPAERPPAGSERG